MTIDIATLRRRWAWTTVLALIVMAVLGWLDSMIKGASGVGIMDFEFARSGAQINAMIAAWAGSNVLAQMGVLIGFDYVYMASYGFSLFYGALAARQAFARGSGARRTLTVLAFAPLAGAAFDVVENALEARMLFGGATDQLAQLAHGVTVAKFALIAVGLVLALAGLAGLAMGRLKRT